MIRVKNILSSVLLAGALVTSPAFAGDDDMINSPEIQPGEEHIVLGMDEPFVVAMDEMQPAMESSDSFDLASLTYCWSGSVFDETSGDEVDFYSLCEAELYDIA